MWMYHAQSKITSVERVGSLIKAGDSLNEELKVAKQNLDKVKEEISKIPRVGFSATLPRSATELVMANEGKLVWVTQAGKGESIIDRSQIDLEKLQYTDKTGKTYDLPRIGKKKIVKLQESLDREWKEAELKAVAGGVKPTPPTFSLKDLRYPHQTIDNELAQSNFDTVKSVSFSHWSETDNMTASVQIRAKGYLSEGEWCGDYATVDHIGNITLAVLSDAAKNKQSSRTASVELTSRFRRFVLDSLAKRSLQGTISLNDLRQIMRNAMTQAQIEAIGADQEKCTLAVMLTVKADDGRLPEELKSCLTNPPDWLGKATSPKHWFDDWHDETDLGKEAMKWNQSLKKEQKQVLQRIHNLYAEHALEKLTKDGVDKAADAVYQHCVESERIKIAVWVQEQIEQLQRTLLIDKKREEEFYRELIPQCKDYAFQFGKTEEEVTQLEQAWNEKPVDAFAWVHARVQKSDDYSLIVLGKKP